MRDSISLTVYYGAELDMAGSTVLALSQSGRTPDVVDYVERARRARRVHGRDHERPRVGARERGRGRAAARGRAGAGGRGDEDVHEPGRRARAARRARGRVRASASRRRCARSRRRWRALIPELRERITSVAVSFAFAGRMFVIGRGAEYATAREIALKLLETCRVAAEPLTATDLAHGPVAALDPLFPVWAIASDDETLPAVLEAAERARAAGATLIASGSAAEAVHGAAFTLPVPKPPSPLLSPLLSVVAGQLFAWALARTKGLDPDEPRGLSKVTLAR